MDNPFDYQQLVEFFIRGDMRGVMTYIKPRSELYSLYNQYYSIFECEHYINYGLPELQEKILLAYQQYYRDVFYLAQTELSAKETLFSRLSRLFGVDTANEDDLAEHISQAFADIGYHVQCGKTNGHYGPYIWKHTISEDYCVTLPDGQSNYRVNILSDFLMRSWMDYLTFGERGTGGWTQPDGVICCIENAWDFSSERFTVSLLKHEAQHVEDLKTWPAIMSSELEYRAKLVELIYSTMPDLLERFIYEADTNRKDDSHAIAAAQIAAHMGDCIDQPVLTIQKRAHTLFVQSTDEMIRKYSHSCSDLSR